MYEKLLSTMREYAEWADENIYGVPIMLPDALRRAADAIEELQKLTDAQLYIIKQYQAYLTKQHWIPVTERLPEEMDRSCCGWSAEIRPSDDVLVWLSPEKRQSVAWYSHTYNDWTTADEKTVYCFGEVTHWMPLPQPPTECRQMVTDSNQLFGNSDKLDELVSDSYKLEEET